MQELRQCDVVVRSVEHAAHIVQLSPARATPVTASFAHGVAVSREQTFERMADVEEPEM